MQHASDRSPVPPPRASRVGVFPLVMLLFFTVSGGPYGLEEVVSRAGPSISVLLIIIVPLLWSLPAILMTAELAAAIPVEGGYYNWAKIGLGPFWGYQAAWWAWVGSFLDMAIYPVLFVTYLSTILKHYYDCHVLDGRATSWAAAVLLIWLLSFVNICGIRRVGMFSHLMGALVVLPFAVMVILVVSDLTSTVYKNAGTSLLPDIETGGVGIAIFVLMWSLSGWESASTVGEEIENPGRTYPLALALAFPMVVLSYLLPVMAGLTVCSAQSDWSAGCFPDVAGKIGGPVLALCVAVGALASTAGLFCAILCSVSRIPFAIARDHCFPKCFCALHPKYGTPWVAIVVCASIYSLMAAQSFASLVIIEVVLYSAVKVLSFASLIGMRVRRPNLHRPFAIPGGAAAIVLVSVCPSFMIVLAFALTVRSEGASGLAIAFGALATGPLSYIIFGRSVERS